MSQQQNDNNKQQPEPQPQPHCQADAQFGADNLLSRPGMFRTPTSPSAADQIVAQLTTDAEGSAIRTTERSASASPLTSISSVSSRSSIVTSGRRSRRLLPIALAIKNALRELDNGKAKDNTQVNIIPGAAAADSADGDPQPTATNGDSIINHNTSETNSPVSAPSLVDPKPSLSPLPFPSASSSQSQSVQSESESGKGTNSPTPALPPPPRRETGASSGLGDTNHHHRTSSGASAISHFSSNGSGIVSFRLIRCVPERGVLEAAGAISKKPAGQSNLTAYTGLGGGWKLRHFWTSSDPVSYSKQQAQITTDTLFCTWRSLRYYYTREELKEASTRLLRRRQSGRLASGASGSGNGSGLNALSNSPRATFTNNSGTGNRSKSKSTAVEVAAEDDLGSHRDMHLSMFVAIVVVPPALHGSGGDTTTATNNLGSDGAAGTAAAGGAGANPGGQVGVGFGIRVCTELSFIDQDLCRRFAKADAVLEVAARMPSEKIQEDDVSTAGVENSITPAKVFADMKAHPDLLKPRRWRGRELQKCFLASDAIDWLMRKYPMQTLLTNDDNQQPDIGQVNTRTQASKVLSTLLLLRCIRPLAGPAWGCRVLDGGLPYCWNPDSVWLTPQHQTNRSSATLVTAVDDMGRIREAIMEQVLFFGFDVIEMSAIVYINLGWSV